MYLTCWLDNTYIPSVFQIASVFQRKAGLKVPMDLFTLIPRTIIGVTYPAFASLKAVLSDSPESCGAWLRKIIHMAFSWWALGYIYLLELLPLKYNNWTTMDFSLQILGGSWRIFFGGIIVGPPDKSTEIFLPNLSHPQVQLPSMVHGPSWVEWKRHHLQQSEYESLHDKSDLKLAHWRFYFLCSNNTIKK